MFQLVQRNMGPRLTLPDRSLPEIQFSYWASGRLSDQSGGVKYVFHCLADEISR